MITVFPPALVTETQSALLTAFGIGGQAAIAFIFVTNISDAKPAIHPTRRYIRYLGTCCHFIYLRPLRGLLGPRSRGGRKPRRRSGDTASSEAEPRDDTTVPSA